METSRVYISHFNIVTQNSGFTHKVLIAGTDTIGDWTCMSSDLIRYF